MVDDDNASKESENTIIATPPPEKVKKPLNTKKKTQFLFEDAEIGHLLRCFNTYPFLKMALTAGSVIFSLPEKHFTHRCEAYKLIEEEIGDVISKMFVPLSVHYPQSDNTLIVSVKFRDEEATAKAIQTGLLVEGVHYRALPYRNFSKLHNYIIVKLTLVPPEEEEVLVETLKDIFKMYGRVVQVTRFCIGGYFEGDMRVILDRSGYSRQLPSRRFHLHTWGMYVPVTYADVIKQVCNRCFETDHPSTNCPSCWPRK